MARTLLVTADRAPLRRARPDFVRAALAFLRG